MPSITLVRIAATMMVAVAVSACTEDLGSGAACPALCPNQNVELVETVIEPVILDTTVVGVPPLGTSGRLYVASRGDTVVTYGVVRFDSLPNEFRPDPDDPTMLPIAALIDPQIRFRIDTVQRLVTEDLTVEVYDVETAESDTNFAAIVDLVRPDRLIGSLTLPADTNPELLFVPLAPEPLLAKMAGGERLRVAIAVRSPASVELRLVSLAATADATLLEYTPVADDGTEGTRIIVQPRSRTPVDNARLAADLTDYIVVAAGSSPVPVTELGVGGLPNRRAYLRFDIPSSIMDSATVVRATLMLTQRPTIGVRMEDTIGVYPFIVTAGAPVTDLARASMLVIPGGQVGLDSLGVVPSGSDVVSLDVVALVRGWRGQDPDRFPRALVLRVAAEWQQPVEIRFFSSDAAPELRPKLRLTYVPRAAAGLP
ncbi:MAG TPA: hypothetical protein VMM18_09285 [Gemmatimonadaceae bacterium]|nr:hypothetical protein [Gemmatimonadaceae bacterium]